MTTQGAGPKPGRAACRLALSGNCAMLGGWPGGIPPRSGLTGLLALPYREASVCCDLIRIAMVSTCVDPTELPTAVETADRPFLGGRPLPGGVRNSMEPS